MLLSKPQFQLDILDSLAGNGPLLGEYAEVYRQYKDTERRLVQLTEQSKRARGEEDYLRFQLNQLQAMKLKQGEDISLEAEHAKLGNITDIKEALWEVERLLVGNEVSLIDNLKTIVNRLQSVATMFPDAQEMSSRVESTLIELKDIASSLSDQQESLQYDPERLQLVENRLNDIFALEQKHQLQSVDELIALQSDYEQRLQTLDNSDEQLLQLQQQMQELQAQAMQLAQQLSSRRRQAANSLGQQLVERASLLSLNNLQFDINFGVSASLTPTGTDMVEFRMAFNKNQSLMPVKDTASGGEISRVMLCIKAIVAQRIDLPTIIFDEVDTGVSGDTASRMGEMMGDIARNIQVIAITHLPQVASHSDNHMKVYKSDDADRTSTHVAVLDTEQHVMEIARMLSGKDVNPAAINNAKTLIEQNKHHD